MKFFWLIAFVIFIQNIGVAQSPKAFVKAGDEAFAKGNYFAALEYFKQAEAQGKSDGELFYKIAEAARHYKAFEFSLAYYQKYLKSKHKNVDESVMLKIGEIMETKGKYTDAINYYKKIIEKNKGGELQYIAAEKISHCEWALGMKASADSIEIVPLNKRVNSPYSDFAPLLINDTLYYSSYRFKSRTDSNEPQRYLSRVLYAIRGAKGRSLPHSFNKKGLLTAHSSISEDGRRIYFTRCNYDKTGGIRCGIFYSEKDKRNRWGKAIKIPELNDAKFTFTHPALGTIGEAKKNALYFVSDRPGGKGKLDIWYALIQDDLQLGALTPLEEVNTEADDITPFYQNGCLFFSSTGHQGLGGYDIFQSCQVGDIWKAVTHMGYPLNSGYDDMYYSPTADSTVAYFASNRLGSMYLDKDFKTCCNDIYKVKYPVEITAEEPEIPVVDSLVMEEKTPEPEPPVRITKVEEKTPERLEDFLPLALYFDNDEPDKRTRKSTTKKTYGESYEAYYARKEIYIREYAAPFSGAEKMAAEKEMENFFNNELKKDNSFLILFSEILMERLSDGETVEIFVKGFTSPRAKSDYNFYLGKRRVSSVVNHFRKFQNGIFLPYLNKGKLIITERSFGESTASKDISDALDDRRNSIYSTTAARERRVEITEIKRNTGK